MNVLPPGTEDITVESGQTLGAISIQTVNTQIFTNETATYYIISIKIWTKSSLKLKLLRFI